MAKAVKAYYGNDSTGRAVEVAQREDNTWFCRVMDWNGYGVGWSRWEVMQDQPKFKTSGINAYTGDEFNIEHGEVMHWGFSTLAKMKSIPKYRLP